MDTPLIYTVLVAAVAVLRLMELRVSKRNIVRLKARGGVEVGYGHYPWMVATHMMWLIACPLEVWIFGRPWIPPLAVAMLLVFVVGAILRHWTIATLGERWSTRVVYVPGDPIDNGGPFRWFRHPNYLGVVLEIVALPLIHTAWVTAVVFSAANALVLSRRIAVENAALAVRLRVMHHGSTDRGGVVPGE